MHRRDLLGFLSALVLCLLCAPAAVAQQPAKDYVAISPSQPGGSDGKVEVIEFVSFACPHCRELEPLLQKWRATLPKDVVFRRVPVSFNRTEWASLGRLYLTLSAMGVIEKVTAPLFEAIHVDRVNMADEKARNEWLVKHGVDAKQYAETSRSFSVDSMARRADQLTASYKVPSVPALAIDGRYLMQDTVSHEQLLKNTDLVIAKVRAERAKK